VVTTGSQQKTCTMGGAQSLFSENDWDAADGHLETADQTIDGAAPTQIYQTYHLIKKAVLANQREFDVTDSTSNLLFHVRPSFGTIAGFDVLGIGSATTDEYILRVTVDIARRHWIVYRFGKPVFEGQKPDEAATLKFAAEQQTSRKELAARISASLAIHSFYASDDDQLDPAIAALPPPSPKHHLYKVCCITVSWSRYMAVAAYYGPPTVEQLLSSKKHEKAVQEMANDEDCGHDLLLQASRIAERMRDRPSLADDIMDDESESDVTHSAAVSQDQSDKGMAAPETDESSDEVPSKENGTYSLPTSVGQNESVIAPSNSNNAPSAVAETAELDKSEPIDTSSACTEETPTKMAAETSLSGDVDTETAVNVTVLDPTTKAQAEPEGAPSDSEDTDEATSSMAGDIADSVESADHVDDTTNFDATGAADGADHVDDKASGSDANPPTIEQDSASVGNDDGDEADDEVPEVKASKSMPELASDTFNTDKLRTWFKETSRTIHSKSKLILRQTNSFDDVDKGGTGNYAAFLGMGSKPAEEDDPLEGVIHLEKPLLLCQEIYTRIIGNHQTSRVSKHKVLSLLKQDMEHHVEGEAGKLDKSDSANDNTASSTGTENGKIVETSSVESKSTNGTLETSATDTCGPLDASERSEKKDQPLVGYWAWEHSLRTHKIKMHLAKGADLALHVVLAVLVNQVRYERNAIAIAV
jgi:hypothetical protein